MVGVCYLKKPENLNERGFYSAAASAESEESNRSPSRVNTVSLMQSEGRNQTGHRTRDRNCVEIKKEKKKIIIFIF